MPRVAVEVAERAIAPPPPVRQPMATTASLAYRRPETARTLVLHAAEAAVLSIATWCALVVLRVLPGPLERMGGASTLFLAGAVAGMLGARRWLRGALTAAAVVIVLVMFSPVSNVISDRWVRNDLLPAHGIDAVVVLSASLHPDTTISSEALDRLLTGITLASATRAPVLVTTTKHERFPAGIVTSETDQRRIIELTRSDADWVRVDAGESTRDEAVAAAGTLRRRTITRIAVVTSPMHTRRACAAFERVGFSVVCVAARMRGDGTRPLSAVPADRFAVFGDWVYEVAAIAKYWAYGWLS